MPRRIILGIRMSECRGLARRMCECNGHSAPSGSLLKLKLLEPFWWQRFTNGVPLGVRPIIFALILDLEIRCLNAL